MKTEGFIIEDEVGFMTKLKLPAYSFWKRMRWLREKLLERQPQIRGGLITTPEEQRVFTFMRSISRDRLHQLSILDVRREYLASQETSCVG